MEIAVLSGKGGTGKTFISTNMARVIANSYYVDCDVEEPNGHLYFNQEKIEEDTVYVTIPKLDEKNCNGCRECVEFCKFNALSYVGNSLLIFDDICHSCGGCILFCKEEALEGVKKPVGKIVRGEDKDTKIYTGMMDIGQASGTVIIDNLIDSVRNKKATRIIDCPPGTACTVMDSIRDANYCVLVAEATIFGLHNFKMVYELLKLFNKTCGVVINKSFNEDNIIRGFCRENEIEILLEIPFDRELGSINSEGRLIVDESPKYRNIFEDLYKSIARRVNDEKVTNP